MEKVIQIGEEDYPEHIVKAYLASRGIKTWLKHITWYSGEIGRLESFMHGYNYGCEVTSDEAPDCDECDVHEKAAERGPPESHYSQQDR